MKNYDEYLVVLDEMEKIEEIIAPPKYKRCCYSLFEILKILVQSLKTKSK